MKSTYLFNLALMLIVLLPSAVYGQINLDQLSMKYARASFDRFYELLSIPNDAHYPDDIEENVKWCEKEFTSRSFQTQRLATDGIPLLLANRMIDGADKTVLIYLQIDGQPVDSSQWFQESPWIPALKQKSIDGSWQEIPWKNIHENYDPEYRIFARAASDAKGPVSMFLAALDAAKDIGIHPNYNIKVIMDFEEELGSPRLPEAVIKYKDQLSADMLIIYDGPRHISNQPTLTYGARGIATVTLEVFGPRFPQHSGHYGNYAPNPAFRLAQLLASMKDDQGRVIIPGWYDGIQISDEVKSILKQVPDDETTIKKNVGIATIDKVAENYQEAIQYPSLNIRGMESGWVRNKVRTIIPATAIAEIDVRLVKESYPELLLSKLIQHIENQGYHFVDGTPTERDREKYTKLISFESEVSYAAFRTDFNSEVGIWLRKALTNAFGQTPIQIRTSGGSIPISPFVTTLGIPAVTVPTVNRDNNQHSPNENIRLGNYVEGIKAMISILQTKL